MKTLLAIAFVALAILPSITLGGDIGKVEILSIPWGKTEASVGFSSRTATREDLGPPSFFVDESEVVYIADIVNKKIKAFKNNKLLKAYNLPADHPVQDIFVTESFVYALTSARFYKLPLPGGQPTIVPIKWRNPGDGRVFVRGEEVLLEDFNNRLFCFTGESVRDCTNVLGDNRGEKLVDLLSADKWITQEASGEFFINSKKTGSRTAIRATYDGEEMYPMNVRIRFKEKVYYTMISEKKSLRIYRHAGS